MTIGSEGVTASGLQTSTEPAAPFDGRARMVASLFDLCQAAPRNRSPQADAALAQAVLPVVRAAERTVRQRLAERLASADWAPHDLVAALTLDEIDVARPLLAHSPILIDTDLLAVLDLPDVDHRVAVARRPSLSPTVADKASTDEEALVLTALASNEHTLLPHTALARLVDAARRTAALRGPLARRRDLDPELALGLYTVVGEALRRHLTERFNLPADRLALAVSGAVDDAGIGQNAERSDMEQRLVEKLQGAGQLRPGFLIKSLREGRLGLFEAALARLTTLPAPMIAASLHADSPEPLALACAAAGLDRGAFPTVLALVRQETGGSPGDAADSLLRVKTALALSAPDAAERLLILNGEAS